MLERLSRSRRNSVLLLLAALALWFCWIVRSVLNALLFGYLLAYILLPLVQRVERRGYSRRAAVNLIFIAGVALTTLVVVLLFGQLRALALEVYSSAKAAATAAPDQGLPLHDALQQRVNEFTATLRAWGLAVGDWEVPDLAGLREQAHAFLDQYGDQAGRTGLTVARAVLVFLASFLRGRLAVAFLKGLFLAVLLTAFGMPYGFLFGMLSGFLSIVPFIGAFAGFVLTLAVGIIDHGVIGSA